jgi:hypothetical protein
MMDIEAEDDFLAFFVSKVHINLFQILKCAELLKD